MHTCHCLLILGLEHINCMDQLSREFVQPFQKRTHHPSPIHGGEVCHVGLVLRFPPQQMSVDGLVLVFEQFELEQADLVLPLLLLLVELLLQLKGKLSLLGKLLLCLVQLG